MIEEVQLDADESSHMSSRSISRRTMLAIAALGLAEATLSACTTTGTAETVVTTETVVAGGAAASTGVSVPASGASSAAPGSTSAPATSAAGSAGPVSSAPATTVTSSAVKPTTPVHLRLYQDDGQTYGVGMPIIAYLSKKITDAKLFAKATSVTVNGVPAGGAWYFQKSAIYAGYPLEAHYRTEQYWPAHAKIALALPIKGLSAGTGLTFDDSLTLTMNTGAANITTVDGSTERLTLTTDGAAKFDFPVSLGKASTPTFTGTKVLMEKDKIERMVGTTPGDLYDLQVPWSVRLTNSGEFIHAASWNGGNIGQRSTSNGCTNLNVDDAQTYFTFARIGDVAVYTNTGGGPMPVWDGYGDWNLPWSTWKQGGSVATS